MKNKRLVYIASFFILVIVYFIWGKFALPIIHNIDQSLSIYDDPTTLTTGKAIFSWTLWGAILGMLYGTFLGIKKLNLKNTLYFVPLGLIVLILSIVFVGRKITLQPNKSVLHDSSLYDLLEEGMLKVDEEKFDDAIIIFKQVNAINPKAEIVLKLAANYTNLGDQKCQFYQNQKQLKYIPNNFYKCAAALTGQTPSECL